MILMRMNFGRNAGSIQRDWKTVPRLNLSVLETEPASIEIKKHMRDWKKTIRMVCYLSGRCKFNSIRKER